MGTIPRLHVLFVFVYVLLHDNVVLFIVICRLFVVVVVVVCFVVAASEV